MSEVKRWNTWCASLKKKLHLFHKRRLNDCYWRGTVLRFRDGMSELLQITNQQYIVLGDNAPARAEEPNMWSRGEIVQLPKYSPSCLRKGWLVCEGGYNRTYRTRHPSGNQWTDLPRYETKHNRRLRFLRRETEWSLHEITCKTTPWRIYLFFVFVGVPVGFLICAGTGSIGLSSQQSLSAENNPDHRSIHFTFLTKKEKTASSVLLFFGAYQK